MGGGISGAYQGTYGAMVDAGGKPPTYGALKFASPLLRGRVKLSYDRLRHSDLGDFTRPQKKGQKSKLKSGGHGQRNIEQMQKRGIEFVIVKTYPNGVRVGHVPRHKDRLKQVGIGQSWFPKSWSKKKIANAGRHVANLKKHKEAKDGMKLFGMFNGVKVGVIKTKGKIGTVFPDSNQPLKRPKHRKSRMKRLKKG